jgi:hypothetical protein
VDPDIKETSIARPGLRHVLWVREVRCALATSWRGSLPTPKGARVRSEVTEASKTVGERILGVLLVNRVGLCRHDEIVLVQVFDLVRPPGDGDFAPLGG